METPTFRVLIADDDEVAVMLLRKGIENPQVEIVTAGSGSEALARLAEGPFQIVLSDIGMPPPNGLELTKIIKEKYPDTDVIILTAYTTMDMVVQALKFGATDYLHKPFDLMLVRAALRRCLEKRTLQARVAALEAAGAAMEARVKELALAVQAAEFGPEHESCRAFAQKILDEMGRRAEGLRPEAEEA